DGTQLEFADDAPTAIHMLEAADQMFGCFHYDHILCDWKLLHGTTGGDVLAWIRARSDTATAVDNDTPKSARQVYLERFTFLADSTLAMELHDRYVSKPCGETA